MKEEIMIWLTDIDYLWNNGRSIYGKTEGVISSVRKEEKILVIGKPSRHNAMSKEEFLKKYTLNGGE